MLSKPMDIAGFLRRFYSYLILIMIAITLKTGFDLTWIAIVNFIKYGLSFILVIFALIYLATFILNNYMLFSLKAVITKFTTAEFYQVQEFWEQTNIFARSKIVSMGSWLGVVCVIEYFITYLN